MTDDPMIDPWGWMDEFRRRIERDRLNEAASFVPDAQLERSALNLLGGYENVRVRVQYFRAQLASRGVVLGLKDRDRPPKVLNRIAEVSAIAWPHNEFSAMFYGAHRVRTHLAHMWWIHAVEGERPDRVMTLVVPTDRGWTDTTWSTPMYSLERVTEAEIRTALNSLRRMRAYVHALQRMIKLFGEMPNTPGDHLYRRDWLPLPWWLEEWGTESKDFVRADQIRTDR
ncbi:MAG: hypothetical protein PGN29_19535 [Gordonia paraffinivorans]